MCVEKTQKPVQWVKLYAHAMCTSHRCKEEVCRGQEVNLGLPIPSKVETVHETNFGLNLDRYCTCFCVEER
jgi:hypothetical protein